MGVPRGALRSAPLHAFFDGHGLRTIRRCPWSDTAGDWNLDSLLPIVFRLTLQSKLVNSFGEFGLSRESRHQETACNFDGDIRSRLSFHLLLVPR